MKKCVANINHNPAPRDGVENVSPEAWLALTGLIVTIAVGLGAFVTGLVGWFLTRLVRSYDQDVRELQQQVNRLTNDQTRIKVILEDRGMIPRTVKYPSPPPMDETG